jgi:hypothetical protein
MHRITVVLAALLGLLLGVWVARPERAVTHPSHADRRLEQRAQSAIAGLLRDDVVLLERMLDSDLRYKVSFAGTRRRVEVFLDPSFDPVAQRVLGEGAGIGLPTVAQVARARALAQALAGLRGVLAVRRYRAGPAAYEVEFIGPRGVTEVRLDQRLGLVTIDREWEADPPPSLD